MAKRPGRAPLTGVLFTYPHQPYLPASHQQQSCQFAAQMRLLHLICMQCMICVLLTALC